MSHLTSWKRAALGRLGSLALLLGCAVSLTAACGDDAAGGGQPSGVSGSPSAGGVSGASGGGSGGATPNGGTSGGTTNTTGGTTTTGGTIASTGGTTNTGGSPTAGGTIASTGGTTNTGGSPTSGGAIASAGGATTSGGAPTGGGGTGGTQHAGPWRIMPLGDSITETTCQTQLLWKKLRDNAITNFDLVGSMKNNQSCGVTNPDQDCEGHGGFKTLQLVSGGKAAANLQGWVTAGNADIVLMHFGTNDMWNSATVNPQPVIDAYGVIVDTFRATNPGVIFFVAQIIPLNPPDCAACDGNVQALNDAIPAFASEKSTAASPVYVVNQYADFTSGSDTGDGVHPNPAGSQKMADRWYAALTDRGIF